MWSVRETKACIRIDPSATLPVTVTRGCGLNCPHCGGHYLKHMVHVDEMEKYLDTYRSFLISGGMDREGRIPFEPYLDKLRRLKVEHGLSYNFHVGFPKRPPYELDEVADVVSFDFFADPEVLWSIYGLRRTPEDILDAILPLKVIKVPHVTVGIACGVITHEYKALEILSQHFPYVVINVFVPTAGTTFSKCSPPHVDEVAGLFEFARSRFDDVFLGCMHPRGTYRLELQERVLNVATGIVKSIDREYDFSGCCALWFLPRNSSGTRYKSESIKQNL
ncbi:radical SAM protein [Fervidobacterium thailandense]|uniref:Radical SAM protein n=1 Tax=Fervidobacterium thailandense TaxID=1008305 RepID=A0A1E3G489_9BACT|nr:radical SAM protein [Fervidobacterium thailandense]ODN31101.1 radical SAM protein [Fervidobacterium thailandense]